MRDTLTLKGQIKLSKDDRDQLALTPGTKLDLMVVDGVVLARPTRRSVKDIIGLLKKPGREAISQKAMDEAIATEASTRFHATRQRLSGANNRQGE